MPPKQKTQAAVSASQEDVAMEEATAATQDLELDDSANPAIYALGDQRIRELPSGGNDQNVSFEFIKEDHTLGNALRYIIMKNPKVDFCGYSIPHPSEALMNIRIQTREDYTAREALQKGLDDLIDLCDIVAEKFVTARTEFAEDNMAS